MSAETSAGTPFHDLGDFVAIPRVGALRLAPDGSWLAAAVQTLSADRKKYLTSIWRIDTQGGPARRLTRSAEGEGNPRFLPDGSLLFTSKRPDPGAGRARAGGSARRGEFALAASRRRGRGQGDRRPARRRRGRGGGGGQRRHRGVRPGACRPPGGTAPRTTPGCAGNARTPGSPRSCTSRRRSGSGTTTWDPTSSGCSPSTRITSRKPKSAGPEGTKSPRWPRGRTGRQGMTAVERADAATFPGLRDLTPEPGRALDGVAFGLTPDGTLGRQRVVPVAPGRRLALRAGDDRRGHREAPGPAQPARVRLRQPVCLARRTVHRLPAGDAHHRRAADGRHLGRARHWRGGYWRPAARPASQAATCCPAWTAGRRSRPGRPIPARCTSPPTTAGGGRCSASRWPAVRSPG